MKDVNYLLKVYQSNLANKIKELAEPLNIHFGIDEFIYTYIGQHGEFFAVSNQPAPNEFYFSRHFYESSLLIRHPDNYKDQALLPLHISKEKQESEMETKFGYSPDNLLAIFRKQKKGVHKFLFNTNKKNLSLIPFYVNNLKILECFCDYFLNEWTAYSCQMEQFSINMAELIGPIFFEAADLSCKNDSIESKLAFLKKIEAVPKEFRLPEPFSKQEKICLNWIYQGKTLKETAELMDLSSRTVEYYYENIKNKLNCYTKSQVLDSLHALNMLGMF